MPALPPQAHDALARARLLVLDVDGTLTDGSVAYVGDEELVRFDVRDGQGLVWLIDAGVEVAWISGRGCRATERRAQELGVREVHLRVSGKSTVLEDVQERLAITPEETIAMGDDLPDLGLAARSALFACPSDSRPELLERAALVLETPGGRGAVRELAEAILRAKGLWGERLPSYVRAPE